MGVTVQPLPFQRLRPATRIPKPATPKVVSNKPHSDRLGTAKAPGVTGVTAANLGAVNIRLRSLFAALDERDEVAEEKAAAKAEA